MRRAALAVIAAALLATACAAEPPPGGVRVSGRILDDETGQPVAREWIYVHGFSDDAGAQVSLDPDSGDTSYSVDLPTRNVRLRIADVSKKYELWQQTLTATGPTLEQDVRLKPTHFVTVKVSVKWRDGTTLRPISDGDGGVRHAQLSFAGADAGQTMRRDDDGSYTLRLPRKAMKILLINTNRRVTPDVIDLTDVKADETEAVFVLEEAR
jgi:hypothetical protein